MSGITITVSRSARGRGGDPVGAPVTHDVDGCIISPRSAANGEDQLGAVIVGLTVYAPFGADIRATDQVVIAAAPWAGTYDIVGEPGRWLNPFTQLEAGTEIALERHR